MIQDIAPHSYNNHYDPKERPDAESYLVYSRDGAILVRKQDDRISFPQGKEIGGPLPDATYLFAVDDMKFFMVEGPAPQGEEYHWLQRREMHRLQPMWMEFIAVTAAQLTNWYRDNRYCSRCGTSLTHDKAERMLRCENCGHMVYPKICPGIIAAVTDGDRILLTRYAGRAYNAYSLIAGFTEIGETVEQTVVREVMEEVGLRVKNLRFYKSQPWSFSDTLLMGFFCDLDGEDFVHLDEDELALAKWFRRDELTTTCDGVSLTNEMIVAFREGKA